MSPAQGAGFAALALVFYLLGRALVPGGLRAATDLLTLAALLVALARMLFAPALPGALRGIFPALAVTAGGAALWGQVAGPGLGALEGWPLILLCLAAWLPGLGPRGPRPVEGPVLGVALALGLICLLPLFLPQALPVMMASPVHLLLWLVFLSVLALHLLAASRRAWPEDTARFAAQMAGLLPLLGFFGTIFGLMAALSTLPQVFADASPDAARLTLVLQGLGTAFETTLIGLAGTMVLTLTGSLLPGVDAQ